MMQMSPQMFFPSIFIVFVSYHFFVVENVKGR